MSWRWCVAKNNSLYPDYYCKYAAGHEPDEICNHCGLQADEYENTSEDFLNCSYPNCGCDGARLCMAPSGPNALAGRYNVEGMYQRTDRAATRAKLGLVTLVIGEREGKNNE